MKKIISICLVLTVMLMATGCQKTKKEQARAAIDLCVQYTRESFDNVTNEKIAQRATEACSAASTLLNEYIDSDEFEENVARDLEALLEDVYTENK